MVDHYEELRFQTVIALCYSNQGTIFTLHSSGHIRAWSVNLPTLQAELDEWEKTTPTNPLSNPLVLEFDGRQVPQKTKGKDTSKESTHDGRGDGFGSGSGSGGGGMGSDGVGRGARGIFVICEH
ncbi:MAG TPA: hypothetical protein VHT73_05885 [Thermodesulfobacteriota bacterium]|nr:hypothetical protein [Thermodesulfobacteriota bacterium]